MSDLMSKIIEGFSRVEIHDERVVSIRINPKTYGRLRKEPSFASAFDPDYNISRLENYPLGFKGSLYGAELYVNSLVKVKEIELTGEKGTRVLVEDICGFMSLQIKKQKDLLKRKFKFIAQED